MARFEYWHTYLKARHRTTGRYLRDNVIETLNKNGAQGWQVISMEPERADERIKGWYITLERKIV